MALLYNAGGQVVAEVDVTPGTQLVNYGGLVYVVQDDGSFKLGRGAQQLPFIPSLGQHDDCYLKNEDGF